ncbi:MAG: hypothetical protein ABL962_13490 [Fimbriimonadaceae bacterium]
MGLKLRTESKRSKWVTGLAVALVLPNFFISLIRSHQLGGDALNGYVKAGHYFLCSKWGCTEVAQSTWTYSYWHEVATIGGFAILFILHAYFATTGEVVLDFSCPQCGSRSTAWWNRDAWSGKCANCGPKS